MGDFIVKHSTNGVWYGEFASLSAQAIQHGISTRLGGRSSAPYASLNLGLHVGDDTGATWQNRQAFCQALGLSAEHAVTADQVHGSVVYQVTAQDAGRGSRHYHEAITGTDALITNVPGIPLMLFFADCVPVIIADPVQKAIGISHAGWKGTVAKIGQKTLLAMMEQYNTNPADCLVGIGPSIGPCCYEVNKPVINKLQENFSRWQELATPAGEHWHLDLWEANRQQLKETGVLDENISLSGVCTACNTQIFYSHRAEAGRTGRIGAVIAL